MTDMVPGAGLRSPATILGHGDVDYLDAMQVVKSVEDINAFGMVPRETLSCPQPVLGCPFVRECNNTIIDVDIAP
jgi:hypothetical protein